MRCAKCTAPANAHQARPPARPMRRLCSTHSRVVGFQCHPHAVIDGGEQVHLLAGPLRQLVCCRHCGHCPGCHSLHSSSLRTKTEKRTRVRRHASTGRRQCHISLLTWAATAAAALCSAMLVCSGVVEQGALAQRLTAAQEQQHYISVRARAGHKHELEELAVGSVCTPRPRGLTRQASQVMEFRLR